MDLLKRFFKFVIPSIVSMWIFSLYTMVDGIFVAWGVGEHALTAVNLSMPFTSLVFMVGILLATGTSTVISIALGQGDLDRARNYFNQNLFVTGIASLLLGALVLLNLERVALFLGATPDTLVYVKEYVGTIAAFAIFFTISYNLEVQVKANGAPHISTIGVISCALMNMVLDAVFVLVFHWGVWGAAFATGLAQVTSTCVFFGYFLTHRERLRVGRFKLDLAAYRRILPLGLSEGLNELSNGLVIFLFNHTILRVIGEGALASYTIISYVNTLVLMTMTGTAQGMQPLVSFHLGAGERKNCHRLLKYGVSLIAAFSVVSFALGELGAPAIVSAFLPTDSAVFSYSISALRMYSSSFLVLGFNVIFAAFFTAVERPVFAFSISFGRSLVLLVASLLILSSLFGDKGIWFSTLCSELLCLCLTAFCAWRYFRSHRRENPLPAVEQV
ncbi:MATE family efflux transporter [Intestinimonas butyriciproducens]|uniref:MATE family efflux transporter n=1 Tax=Intestinimonas butyriciproducens TaxID=1297617 RepID=UPI001FAD8744|nr:MATE family efflux transporter [Intestinimonas butyriciproducens]